jgi:hypothetical protein
LAEYNISARKWNEHTNTEEFITQFTAIMEEHNQDNDRRAIAIEEFMISEAEKAGVIKISNKRNYKNPNRWEKQLAPWFTTEC